MHGSTGGGWKRNASASPRQLPTQPSSITAPPAGQPNQGLAIVADRNNTGTFSFRGTQTTQNTGTIYAKSGTLDVRGNTAVLVPDSLVVVGDLTFSGTVPVFQSSYSSAKNVSVFTSEYLSK